MMNLYSAGEKQGEPLGFSTKILQFPPMFFITSADSMSFVQRRLYRFFQLHIFFIGLLLWNIVSVVDIWAQGRTVPDSRGRDFWFAFPPNFHSAPPPSIPTPTDSLYIFVTCDVPTTGVIEYRNRQRNRITVPFAITDPTQVYRFALSFRDGALLGYNQFGVLASDSDNERVVPFSFNVRSQNDVTVYGLSVATNTSDAFLAYPTNSLGSEYVVMSYPTDDGPTRGFGSTNAPPPTPSQFVVVGVLDSTDVIIRPSAGTRSNGTQIQRVRLNRGDVYLVQADYRSQGGNFDLTGSRVISTKPVAVFGSHQRSTLPVQLAATLASRDYLLEQMPPLETWGKQAFITPYTRARGETASGTDLYRVLAAYDSTVVFLNNQQVAVLNAGRFYEASLTEPGVISASDQILVAQFKKTAQTATEFNNIGDPFMMVIPPTEQYDTSYRFVNAQGFQLNNRVNSIELAFQDHFITVIVPTRFANTVRLDGALVNAGSFLGIPNTLYSYANIQLSAGVHAVRADTAIGLYVYGYGPANSYGYIGGGKFQVIAPDRNPPLLVTTATCFGMRGIFYDTLITDSRIDVVRVESNNGNVDVNIEAFRRYADSVRFTATLRDRLRDGFFTIMARDSVGSASVRDSARNTTRATIGIPGFTVHVAPVPTQVSDLVRRSIDVPAGFGRCFPVTLTNYGQFTQTLTTIRMSGRRGEFQVNPALPLRLLPGEQRIVNVCFRSTDSSGTLTDTLFIGNDCLVRPVLELSVTLGRDLGAPTVASNPLVCSSNTVTIAITETARFVSGIRAVTILDSVNCGIRIVPSTNASWSAVVSVRDPLRDAIWAFSVVDSAGNSAQYRDTIQGFTLRFEGIINDLLDMGSLGITALTCRDVRITNYGLKPFDAGSIRLRKNITFSVPPSDRGGVIAPNSTRVFRVCFAPLTVGESRDTLDAESLCLRRSIGVFGVGQGVERVLGTRCNAEIRIISATAPLRFFMEQNAPNPARDVTEFRFALEQAGRIRLALYDSAGELVETLLNDARYPQGEFSVSIDVSRLAPGVYFAELITDTQRTARQVIVLR